MKIILSGPSGAGKDTLIDLWTSINPQVKRAITATTRPPRQGEVDGVDYHFYTMEEMKSKIANNEFLEYMNVFGNIYGTPKSSVEAVCDMGCIPIIRIDVQGAIELIPKMTDVVSVFILPPSLEELRKRIVKRQTETPEKIEERMDTATAEIMCSYFYDNQIVNDNLEDSINDLNFILNGGEKINTDLADECLYMTLNQRTIEKIDFFLEQAENSGLTKNTKVKIIYETTYCGKPVGVKFSEQGRLQVVFLDKNEKFSFSYHYGSSGEMDVITEFVKHLMKNPQNAVDNS